MLVRHQHYETFWGSGVWNPNKPLLATGIPGWTVYIPTCYTTCFLQFHSLQPNYTCSSLWKFLYGSNKTKHSNFHPRHRHRHSKPVGALKTSTLHRVACFVAQSARPGIKIPSLHDFSVPFQICSDSSFFFKRRGRCLLNRGGPFIRQIHQEGVAPFTWSGSKSHQKSTLVFHRFLFWTGRISQSINLIMYTWNLFVLYFWAWTLQKKALSNQNNGHFGLQVLIYIYKLRLNQYHSGKTGTALSLGACKPLVALTGSQPQPTRSPWSHQKRGRLYGIILCQWSAGQDQVGLCLLFQMGFVSLGFRRRVVLQITKAGDLQLYKHMVIYNHLRNRSILQGKSQLLFKNWREKNGEQITLCSNTSSTVFDASRKEAMIRIHSQNKKATSQCFPRSSWLQ